MDELDKKLKEIKVSVWHAGQGTFEYPLSEKNVEQIKQAFVDAGWIPPNLAKEITDVKKHVKGCMTGPEFYDRFEVELLDKPAEFDRRMNAMVEVKEVRAAAKKAAGIE